MKKPDLAAKTTKELERESEKLRLKLSELKTDRYLKEVKNIRSIRQTRRQLARVLTAVKAAGDRE
ncbi:MAG TPA: 50S ribosomal protein L29 [Candidatus Saccharimonadales bacterium]